MGFNLLSSTASKPSESLCYSELPIISTTDDSVVNRWPWSTVYHQIGRDSGTIFWKWSTACSVWTIASRVSRYTWALIIGSSPSEVTLAVLTYVLNYYTALVLLNIPLYWLEKYQAVASDGIKREETCTSVSWSVPFVRAVKTFGPMYQDQDHFQSKKEYLKSFNRFSRDIFY